MKIQKFKQYLNYLDQYWKNRNRDKLLEILPKNSIGVEVGVYRGDFSKKIMRVVRPEKLYLIDPWYKLGFRNYEWSLLNRSVLGCYIKVLKIFEDALVKGKVEVRVGYSSDVLKEFPDNYFDWAYVDSSHSYKETMEELEILKHKVKDDGYIAGHDYQADPSHPHYGVYKAVNEFIKVNGYDLVYTDEATQWCVRKG